MPYASCFMPCVIRLSQHQCDNRNVCNLPPIYIAIPSASIPEMNDIPAENKKPLPLLAGASKCDCFVLVNNLFNHLSYRATIGGAGVVSARRCHGGKKHKQTNDYDRLFHIVLIINILIYMFKLNNYD